MIVILRALVGYQLHILWHICDYKTHKGAFSTHRQPCTQLEVMFIGKIQTFTVTEEQNSRVIWWDRVHANVYYSIPHQKCNGVY